MKKTYTPMQTENAWPEIFARPELIETLEPAELCADGLTAWAHCMCGHEPPKSFGDVLVKVAGRLGMKKAATSDNLTEYATEAGWLNSQDQERR